MTTGWLGGQQEGLDDNRLVKRTTGRFRGQQVG